MYVLPPPPSPRTHLFPETLLFFEKFPRGIQLPRILCDQILQEQRDDPDAFFRPHLCTTPGAATFFLHLTYKHFRTDKKQKSE